MLINLFSNSFLDFAFVFFGIMPTWDDDFLMIMSKVLLFAVEFNALPTNMWLPLRQQVKEIIHLGKKNFEHINAIH